MRGITHGARKTCFLVININDIVMVSHRLSENSNDATRVVGYQIKYRDEQNRVGKIKMLFGCHREIFMASHRLG